MRGNNLFSNVWNMPYGHIKPFKIYDAAKNSKDFVQRLELQLKIPVHEGCVNSICWNPSGKFILSGSDDQKLAVTNCYDGSVLAYADTGHRANIFSAKFLPCRNDSHVVSCSGDGVIIYTNFIRPRSSLENKFTCHRGTAYEIVTIDNEPDTFLSCGEDKTVRFFDLRTKTSCSKPNCKDDVLINCKASVTSLAVNPVIPYQLAIGCADSSVRIFDRRMLSTQSSAGDLVSDGFKALMTCFTVPEFEQNRRITSLCYSSDGREMLVSYSSDYIYLFNVRGDLEDDPKLLTKDGSSTSDSSNSDLSLLSKKRPVMKKFRLRGDWTDTGPNARPSSEGRSRITVPPITHVGRGEISRDIGSYLRNLFNNSRQRAARTAALHSTSPSSDSSRPQDSNIDHDGTQDENSSAPPVQQETSVGQTSEANPTAPETLLAQSDVMEVENSEGNSNSILNVPDNTIAKQNISETPTTDETVGDNSQSTNYSAFQNDQMNSTNNVDINEPSSLQVLKNKKDLNIDKNDVDASTSEQTPDMFTDSSSLHEKAIGDLESGRKSLVEKHNVEPMANLHFSGQDTSSGSISMDSATSTTPNERQWLEQRAAEVLELPTSVSNTEQTTQENDLTEEFRGCQSKRQQSSSDSETEAAVQTIQPNENLHQVNLSEYSTRTRTVAELDSGEDEMEVIVDSCSWDSDEEAEDHSRGSPDRNLRSRCRKHADEFVCTLSQKVKAAKDSLKKDNLDLPNVFQPRVKRKYVGHRNARTMIKESTFWGDKFVMSGSDCGHIFIWDRDTTELVMIMEADQHVVNCLQPHPYDPILASSGIDYDIKLWAPTAEGLLFCTENAKEIVKRNEIMLEETKDTVTLPATFMIRMMSSLNNYRNANRWSRAARETRAMRERESSEEQQ